MRRLSSFFILAACTVGLIAFAPAASAGHETDPRTPNLDVKGHIVEPAVLGGFGGADPDIHTDIAFWGKHAFQGNWDGFNIRDISDPANPTQVSRTFCDGNQGDVSVWGDILVRSWNTPAGTPGAFGAGLTCDGQAVAPGFEGVHIFDISNKLNPELVGSVETVCGSHTSTLVPDLDNDRVIVYSNVSAGCNWIDIIEVPLDDPGSASLINTEPLEHPCHDMGVILGDAMLAACAGGEGFPVFSLGGDKGGSLEDPELLYHVVEPGVTIGHGAGFSWDGETILFVHEPGGGITAACEATDPDLNKTLFLYDADDGSKVGEWVLPRSQSSTENCTLHNFNVVPLRSGRDVLTIGNYQAGTWVVDFTDRTNPQTLGWSDPPPKPVPPGTPFCCDVTGAWSSYWYNNFIHESNIGEGLNIFRFSGSATAGAMRLGHLNPPTQEFTIP
jgi:hypothetical protein